MRKKVNVSCIPHEVRVHYLGYDKVQDLRTKYVKKNYYNLANKTVQGGVIQELTEEEYPITPEKVKSYVDSVNYKLDLDGNLKLGRKNIVDANEVQRMLSMDSNELQAVYDTLKKVVQARALEKEVVKEVKSEVKENG